MPKNKLDAILSYGTYKYQAKFAKFKSSKHNNNKSMSKSKK